MMRIAVIGSGIGGLCASWLLGPEHHLTVYERRRNPGMDADSIDLYQAGELTRIDVPLRVFQSDSYQDLNELYRLLGVRLESIDFSSSFGEFGGDSYFFYKNIVFGNLALPYVPGKRLLEWRTLRIAATTARFFASAKLDAASEDTASLTFAEYLKTKGYSTAFVDGFVFPLVAGLCTCTYRSVGLYPAATILTFLSAGLLFSSTRRSSTGLRDIVENMLTAADQIYLETAVDKLILENEQVVVIDARGRRESFDQVVIAAQAHQARNLLPQVMEAERECLDEIPYESSRIVVHRDRRLAPSQESDVAPLNFLLREGAHKPMVTVWLNAIQPELGREMPLFQTWNPLLEPEPELLIGDFTFARPVVTHRSEKAVRRLMELQQQKKRRIWLCGTYARPGVPLLENAVVSAFDVCESLGVGRPWKLTG